MKRIFLIVLDSFGIGELEDAGKYGDSGTNTLLSVSSSSFFAMPNMKKLGLFNIDGVDYLEDELQPSGAYARMKEASAGKDTTIGHWEIAGMISEKPLPTYPNGFPKEVIEALEKATQRGILCNLPYSGTKVIEDYGEEHMKTGKLIVYTSADSVLQIAAHEDIVPVEQLYEYCKMARKILVGEHGVGRVIARPFIGTKGAFERTSRRHDYSLVPPKDTVLDVLKAQGKDVIAIGKINDIFAGKGITEYTYTGSNAEGIEKTLAYLSKDFDGLCFVNLVDYDMLYGHRRDIDGYAKALKYFDDKLPEILCKLRDDDVLMITADHGCDPGYSKTTDHTREYTPLLIYGKNIEAGNLGTKDSFADIAATIQEYFGMPVKTDGKSLL